jgi:hypothetical protein
MAGDWIKVEKATPRKPEILAVAEALSIHPDHAFGLCVRFWCWCDDHLSDCNARSVTKTSLDALLDRSGFSEALIKVGWLQARSDSLVIPNFDRHLSQTAKKRALTTNRVLTHRERKCNAGSVTKALPEKRREDNKHEREHARELPDWKLVKAFADTIGLAEWRAQDWFNEMEGAGWIDYQQRPIVKWQAVLTRVKAKWEADGRPMAPGLKPGQKPPTGGKYDNAW